MNATKREDAHPISWERDMSVAEIVEKALKENPDIRLALEAANRARDAESKEAPREIGMATEVVAIPLNPQCPVSLVTLQ